MSQYKERFEKVFSFYRVTCVVVVTFILVFVLFDKIFLYFTPNPLDKVEHQYWLYKQMERKSAGYVPFKGDPKDPRINSLGYRGKEPSHEKTGYKIFFLGGSTSFEGYPPIPERVEKLIDREDVSVYNFAYPSSKSGDELARLTYEISEYQPDLIISYSMANDIADPSGDLEPCVPFNHIMTRSNPLLIKNIKDYPTIPLLLYGSGLMRSLLHPLLHKEFLRFKDIDLSPNHLDRRKVDCFIRNQRVINYISQGMGAKYLLFLQPILALKAERSLSPGEKKALNMYHREGSFTSRKRVQDMYLGIKAKLNVFDGKDVISFYDLTKAFDDEKGQVFHDPMHLSNEKYRSVIAEKIYRLIKDKIPRQ